LIDNHDQPIIFGDIDAVKEDDDSVGSGDNGFNPVNSDEEDDIELPAMEKELSSKTIVK
jgi:hypothetical protein